MSDRYIDYMECVEYGQYFITEGQSLVGQPTVVNMELLLTRMREAVAVVVAELGKAGIHGSTLRGGRTDLQDAVAAGREALERFYHYLYTLPGSTRFDFAAFFPGQSLGNLGRLKPADLRGKMDSVLRGFAAPWNAASPLAPEWQQTLTQARDTLAAAIAGKGDARVNAIVTNAGLASARRRFLAFYNGVAKNAVRSVLHELDRSKDLRLYFLDLQIHESRQPGEPIEPGDPGEEDAATPPGEPGTVTPVLGVMPRGPRARA